MRLRSSVFAWVHVSLHFPRHFRLTAGITARPLAAPSHPFTRSAVQGDSGPLTGWSARVMSQQRSRPQTAAVMPVCGVPQTEIPEAPLSSFRSRVRRSVLKSPISPPPLVRQPRLIFPGFLGCLRLKRPTPVHMDWDRSARIHPCLFAQSTIGNDSYHRLGPRQFGEAHNLDLVAIVQPKILVSVGTNSGSGSTLKILKFNW